MSFIAGYLLGLGEGEAVTEEGLLKYVLQNATLVATCQHTTDYSVKVYYGTMSYQDPNATLFSQRFFPNSASERYGSNPAGFLIANTNKENYGVVALRMNPELEDFFAYIARILFKKDIPLYGEIELNVASVYRASYKSVNIYENNMFYSPRTIKEVVTVYTERKIPKEVSYIGDYKLKKEHDINPNTGKINNTYDNLYDLNNNIVDPNQIKIQIPYYIKKYSYEFNKISVINPGTGKYVEINDDTERPVVKFVEDVNPTSFYSFAILSNKLPQPNVLYNITLDDLNEILFDYGNQCWSEATPSGYTPYAVKSEILPYPN